MRKYLILGIVVLLIFPTIHTEELPFTTKETVINEKGEYRIPLILKDVRTGYKPYILELNLNKIDLVVPEENYSAVTYTLKKNKLKFEIDYKRFREDKKFIYYLGKNGIATVKLVIDIKRVVMVAFN